MMPVVLAVVAALGAVAVWRRKKIGSDAQRIGSAAQDTIHKMRSGRKDLLTELGSHVYAQSTGGSDVDHEAEIKRIVAELELLDAEGAEGVGETEKPDTAI